MLGSRGLSWVIFGFFLSYGQGAPDSHAAETAKPAVGVKITSPRSGQVVSGYLKGQAEATSGARIVSVKFYIDGTLKRTDPNFPYGFTNFDTRVIANGSHTMKAVASDSNGKEASASVTFIVKNPFSIKLSSAPSNAGIIQGPNVANAGQSITLRAVPSSSAYVFDHWEGGASGTQNPITFTVNASTSVQAIFTSVACPPLYVGQNNYSSKRFNIVFVGAGFESMAKYKSATKLLIDLDNTTRGLLPGIPNQARSLSGLMQIPVYSRNRASFNFWYVNHNEPFPGSPNPPDGHTVAQALSPEHNRDNILRCQQILPNRIIPVFIYPTIDNAGTDNTYPYASMGRKFVTVNDRYFDRRYVGIPSGVWQYTGFQSDLHELQHTIPCLPDEYGKSGAGGAPYAGKLTGNPSRLFWKGSSYASCIANAPWKARIGSGCKMPDGSTCWDASKPGCALAEVSFENGIAIGERCCKAGVACFAEIRCFQGGLYADTGIWRPSAGTIMRNPYFLDFTPATSLNEVDQDLIEQIIRKGPAVGKHWSDTDFQLDCDVTSSRFANDGP